MRSIISACALAFVAGCATTSGSAPTETRSGFDGARVVNIEGHGLACKRMLCPGLGAQWNSGRPGSAVLTVYLFNDWQAITGAKLSIDGQVIELTPLKSSITTFSRPGEAVKVSRRDFVADLATVRQMASGGKAWLRVGTLDGYIEEAVIDGPTDSKAFHALRRFLAQVDG